MEKFIVIALATSSPHSFENCQVISVGTEFIKETHKIVFGPGSKEECEAWIAANPVKLTSDTENPDATQTDYSSSNPGIIALGIYLVLITILSVVSLTFLMRSDTDAYLDDGKTLRSCNSGKFSNANVGNSNTNISNLANNNANVNTNAGSNVNANTNVSTNANTNANTNDANTKANANRTTDTNRKATTAPTKNSNETPSNTNPANKNSDLPVNSGKTIGDKIPELTVPPYVCSTVFDLLSADAFVFLVVFFSGMLGAMIRAVYSFVRHLGQNDFSFKWTWYYLLLPLLGGTLSLGLYFVLRGGFYGASFGKGLTLNIYSFAAFSALTGLFTGNALEKLRLVAVTLLADVPPKVENSKEVQQKKEDAKKL